MIDETRLGRSLHELVPDPPTPASTRIAGIERQVRRRRNRVRIAAVTGCVATIAIGAAAVFAGDGRVQRDSSPARPNVEVVPDISCAGQPDLPLPPGPGTVREDAIAARLCVQAPDGSTEASPTLTDGLSDLIGVINGAPLVDSDFVFCSSKPGAQVFTLIFAYPDGTRQAAVGSTDGCDALLVNRVEREVASATLEMVQDRAPRR
jgi:hypothetical protein